MAELEILLIHTTDTPEGRKVTKQDIEQWHLIERKWKKVGYADMVHLDGRLENLIEFDQDDIIDPWEISNGAKGYNGKARHIVYVGGASADKPSWMKHYPPKDTRTPQQLQTLECYVKFTILRHPNIKIGGHNQVANKACPSFDVPKWLREIGICEKNILQL